MSDMGHVRSDDIEGAIEGTLRTMVAAAGRMGERLARVREDAARRAEAQDTQRAREYQAQLEQERATARAQLRPVNEPVWWDRANANDIASAYETASAWQGEDLTIADAAAKMRDELRERYGIDTDNIGADPAQVAEALRQREAQLDLAADSHDDAQQDRHEASSLVRDADAHDRAAQDARDAERGQHEVGQRSAAHADRTDADHEWDSAERRDAHAQNLAAAGVAPEAIQAQYGADVSNARHPRAAVSSTRTPTKARKASPRVPGTQRDRGDRSR